METEQNNPDAGLISCPAESTTRQTSLLVVSVGFLFLLVGTLVIDSIWPVALRSLAGAERKRYREFRDQSSFADGSLARRVQSELRLKSRVRKSLNPTYSWLLLQWFSEAQGLHVGQDGFLFLKSRASAPKDPRSCVTAASNQLIALDRMLEGHGTRLVVVPIPRKAVVLGDLLPDSIQPMPEVERELVAALGRQGLAVVDLLDVYSSQDPRDLFFRGDSHWTPLAEDLAAQEIARISGILIAPDLRSSTLHPSGEFSKGFDLYQWMAVGTTPQAVAAIYADQRQLFDAIPKTGGAPLSRENTKKKGKIVLAGTSFTAHRSMRMLLSHYSNQEVVNVGQRGVGAIAPLNSYLAGLKPSEWPELVILEFPVSSIIPPLALASVARLGPNSSPTKEPTLVDPSRWELTNEASEDDERWARVARLPAGNLAHSGDGVLSLRLSGEVSVKRFQMQLVVDGLIQDLIWPKSKGVICLPLATRDSYSGAIELYARAFRVQALKLESVAVVQSMQGLGIIMETEDAPFKSKDNSSYAELKFPKPAIIPRRGVLQILSHPGSSSGRLEVRLNFKPVQSISRVYSFESLLNDAPITINLHGQAGLELQSVTLLEVSKEPSLEFRASAVLLGP